jgi:uncharacterized protein YbjT (DUF2867 family)
VPGRLTPSKRSDVCLTQEVTVEMKIGKVLVVGATGRVGGAAVEELLGAGFEVRALVRSAQKAQRLRKLGAEVAVGDVTQPRTLVPAVQGCFGVFSALGAGPGRGSSEVVEYKGNLNLLSAARSSGVERFVYSSALMADHPQAQQVGPFREKVRFEQELMSTEEISATVLRPAMFMETLYMMLQGRVAFVPERQRHPISFISARDIARATVQAFQWKITGRYELAGPDTVTFDEAFERYGKGSGKRILVLHVPLAALRVPGRVSPYVRELADMMALFDIAGYAADPSILRDTFGVSALTLQEWAGGDR